MPVDLAQIGFLLCRRDLRTDADVCDLGISVQCVEVVRLAADFTNRLPGARRSLIGGPGGTAGSRQFV